MLHLVLLLSVGALAGYIAGIILKDNSLGLAKNIAVGILGSVLGILLLPLVGVQFGSLVGMLLMAIAGAAILLVLIGLFNKEKTKEATA